MRALTRVFVLGAGLVFLAGCPPPPTGADAGVDAGAPDAGGFDGGFDGGGPVDAGTLRPCLDQPPGLPRVPSAGLPCDLISPAFMP